MAYEHIKDTLRESCSYMLIDASHKPYPAMVNGVLRTPDCDDIATDMRESLCQGNNCLWYDCDMSRPSRPTWVHGGAADRGGVGRHPALRRGAGARQLLPPPGIVDGSVAYSKSAGGLCFDTAPGPWSIGFLVHHNSDLSELDWQPLSHEPRDLTRLVNCVAATTQDEQALAYFEYTRARLRTKSQSSEFMRQLAQCGVHPQHREHVRHLQSRCNAQAAAGVRHGPARERGTGDAVVATGANPCLALALRSASACTTITLLICTQHLFYLSTKESCSRRGSNPRPSAHKTECLDQLSYSSEVVGR